MQEEEVTRRGGRRGIKRPSLGLVQLVDTKTTEEEEDRWREGAEGFLLLIYSGLLKLVGRAQWLVPLQHAASGPLYDRVAAFIASC